MVTAEELKLLGLDEGDDTIVIDNDLRTISIPPSVSIIGVESDDDVLRLNFRMPSFYDDIDLREFDICINYLNAKGAGDLYRVSDKVGDEESITFSWLVGRNATAYKGNVTFNVCLKLTDENNIIVKEFNTTIATLPVLQGLETSEMVIQQNADVIEELRKELFGVVDGGVAKVEKATEEAITTIQNEAERYVKEAVDEVGESLKQECKDMIDAELEETKTELQISTKQYVDEVVDNIEFDDVTGKYHTSKSNPELGWIRFAELNLENYESNGSTIIHDSVDINIRNIDDEGDEGDYKDIHMASVLDTTNYNIETPYDNYIITSYYSTGYPKLYRVFANSTLSEGTANKERFYDTEYYYTSYHDINDGQPFDTLDDVINKLKNGEIPANTDSSGNFDVHELTLDYTLEYNSISLYNELTNTRYPVKTITNGTPVYRDVVEFKLIHAQPVLYASPCVVAIRKSLYKGNVYLDVLNISNNSRHMTFSLQNAKLAEGLEWSLITPECVTNDNSDYSSKIDRVLGEYSFDNTDIFKEINQRFDQLDDDSAKHGIATTDELSESGWLRFAKLDLSYCVRSNKVINDSVDICVRTTGIDSTVGMYQDIHMKSVLDMDDHIVETAYDSYAIYYDWSNYIALGNLSTQLWAGVKTRVSSAYIGDYSTLEAAIEALKNGTLPASSGRFYDSDYIGKNYTLLYNTDTFVDNSRSLTWEPKLIVDDASRLDDVTFIKMHDESHPIGGGLINDIRKVVYDGSVYLDAYIGASGYSSSISFGLQNAELADDLEWRLINNPEFVTQSYSDNSTSVDRRIDDKSTLNMSVVDIIGQLTQGAEGVFTLSGGLKIMWGKAISGPEHKTSDYIRTVPILFPQAFSSEPTVIVNKISLSNVDVEVAMNCCAGGIGKDGFSVIFHDISSALGGYEGFLHANWIAIGN